jgi:hypothetical protein
MGHSLDLSRMSRMTAERTPVERADHTGIPGRTAPRLGLDRGYLVGDGKKGVSLCQFALPYPP